MITECAQGCEGKQESKTNLRCESSLPWSYYQPTLRARMWLCGFHCSLRHTSVTRRRRNQQGTIAISIAAATVIDPVPCSHPLITHSYYRLISRVSLSVRLMLSLADSLDSRVTANLEEPPYEACFDRVYCIANLCKWIASDPICIDLYTCLGNDTPIMPPPNRTSPDNYVMHWQWRTERFSATFASTTRSSRRRKSECSTSHSRPLLEPSFMMLDQVMPTTTAASTPSTITTTATTTTRRTSFWPSTRFNMASSSQMMRLLMISGAIILCASCFAI